MKLAPVEVSLASSDPCLPSTSISALTAARELGATTLVASADPSFYRGQIDHLVDAWVTCDTLDPDAIVSAVGPHEPDALLSFSDLFIPEANAAAARLALKHPSCLGSPAVARDKATVRAALDAAGLPNVDWAVVDASDPSDMPLGFPVVVKPIDGCASWDVRLVRDADELTEACTVHLSRTTYGRGVTPRHQLLCETVLRGPLVSVEGFASEGKVRIWGHTDRTLSDPPFYVETSSAFGPQPLHPDLDAYTHAVIAATGYRFGPFHLEVILTERGPILVELNPRLIGGGAHECIDLATGGDSSGEVVRRYLGLGPALPPPARASCLKDLLATETGTIVDLQGLAEAAAMPGVIRVVCSRAVGDRCRVTHSNSDGFGYVVTVGADRADARRKAAVAAARIRVVVEAP